MGRYVSTSAPISLSEVITVVFGSATAGKSLANCFASAQSTGFVGSGRDRLADFVGYKHDTDRPYFSTDPYLNVDGATETSLSFGWKAHDDVTIRLVRIYYRVAGSGSSYSYQDTGNSTGGQLTNLNSGTSYECFVRLYDWIGYYDRSAGTNSTISSASTISDVRPDPHELSFVYSGGTLPIYLDCDGSWTAVKGSGSWFSIDRTSGGAGNDMEINVTAQSNSGNDYTRSSYVDLKNSDGSQVVRISIHQDADPYAGGGLDPGF